MLADRAEIHDLMSRYALAIDTGDWDTLDRVFTSDAQIDYTSSGGIAGTFAEIKDWLPKVLGLFAATQHYVSNITVDFSGDGATATSRTYLYNPMSLKQEDGSLSLFTIGGYYDDRLVRTADGWRIAERVEIQVWRSGLT